MSGVLGAWPNFAGAPVLSNRLPHASTVATGGYKAGARSGAGVMLQPDGGCYVGDFAGDTFEGSGRYHYPDGSCYIGEWKEGRKAGSGAL